MENIFTFPSNSFSSIGFINTESHYFKTQDLFNFKYLEVLKVILKIVSNT